MPTAPEDKITYDAPIGSIDLAAFDEHGNAYSVWPCRGCLPWHAEVIRDGEQIMVREWHAVGCEEFQSLLTDG